MNLREALEAVHARHGALTPALVVEEARDGKDAVAQFLHARLTWDDEEAGEQWRLWEARSLIRRVTVVYQPTERSSMREIRAFMPVPTATGRSYEPIESIARDPVASAIVLADAERAWQDLKSRYGHLRQFVEMVQAEVAELERQTKPKRKPKPVRKPQRRAKATA